MKRGAVAILSVPEPIQRELLRAAYPTILALGLKAVKSGDAELVLAAGGRWLDGGRKRVTGLLLGPDAPPRDVRATGLELVAVDDDRSLLVAKVADADGMIEGMRDAMWKALQDDVRAVRGLAPFGPAIPLTLAGRPARDDVVPTELPSEPFWCQRLDLYAVRRRR